MKENRPQIPLNICNLAAIKIQGSLIERLNEKGFGTFASTHELLGIITEEYFELVEAIKLNDKIKIRHELIDLGVASTFGLACLAEGKIETRL